MFWAMCFIRHRYLVHDIKVAQATYGQLLAYQMSVFHVDIDQSPKYGAARVIAFCLCNVIFIKGLYILTFPLKKECKKIYLWLISKIHREGDTSWLNLEGNVVPGFSTCASNRGLNKSMVSHNIRQTDSRQDKMDRELKWSEGRPSLSYISDSCYSLAWELVIFFTKFSHI